MTQRITIYTTASYRSGINIFMLTRHKLVPVDITIVSFSVALFTLIQLQHGYHPLFQRKTERRT